MGCGCGNGPKKYKHEKLKTKKKSVKNSKLVQKSKSKSKPKPKPKITSKIEQIKPTVPVVSKIGKTSKNARLLKNCPICKSPMREVAKLGDGKYMECINPECRYSRKNAN